MVGTSSIGSRSVVPAWELSPCQALTAQIPVPPFSIEPAQGSARRESAYPTPIDAISGRAQRAASLVRTATVRATLQPRLIAIKDETPPLPDQPRSRLEKALGAVTIVKGGEGIGALVLTLDSLVLPAACCRLMIVRELVILAGSGVEFTADSEAGQDVLLLFIVPMCGATASKVNRTQLIRAVALFFAPRSDDSQLPKPKRRARGCRVIPVGGHLRWAGHLGVPGLCQRPSLAQTGQVAAPADRPARALPSSSCLGGAAGRLCDDQPLTPRSIRWTTATSAPSTRPPRRSCICPRAGGRSPRQRRPSTPSSCDWAMSRRRVGFRWNDILFQPDSLRGVQSGFDRFAEVGNSVVAPGVRPEDWRGGPSAPELDFVGLSPEMHGQSVDSGTVLESRVSCGKRLAGSELGASS